MSEHYPVDRSSDTERIKCEIFDSMFSHWHSYFSMPEGKRLGDVYSWEVVLQKAAGEVGISGLLAQQLSDEAKDRVLGIPELTPTDFTPSEYVDGA